MNVFGNIFWAGHRVCLVALFCMCSMQLSAQFYYNESCRNATGAFQVFAYEIGADSIGYTAGRLGDDNGLDQDGQGWLRLTATRNSHLGYVLLDGSFPSSMGVIVEFDFKIWANTINGRPADGFSVFLFDGSPSSTFKIGGSGGSLGYQNMKSAYLGVGIDECGNFSNWGTWVDGTPHPGQRRHSIGIRNAAYQYVDGTLDSLKNTPGLGATTLLAYTTATQTRPDDATIYRRAKIEMDPILGGMAVTVSLKMSPTGTGPTHLNHEKPLVINTFNTSMLTTNGQHI